MITHNEEQIYILLFINSIFCYILS